MAANDANAEHDAKAKNDAEKEIIAFARSRQSPGRFAHSLRVAETAEALAAFFGGAEKAELARQARTAGLLHDIAREVPCDELLRLAKSERLSILPEEEKNPVLLHGKVGAALLRKEFPFLNGEIFAAVANHTCGGDEPGVLEKIIYIADYIEPGRDYGEPEFARWDRFSGLDEFFLRVKEKSESYYRDKSAGDGVS